MLARFHESGLRPKVPYMGNTEKTTLLLVDDNLVFLSIACQFLAHLPDFEIVGQAHDGRSAVTLAATLKPDLVLMDISMPHMNGLEAARLMNDFAQPPRIIFMSMHDSPYYQSAARDLGARGFVDKGNLVAELVPLLASLAADMNLHKSPVVPHASH